MGFLCRSGLLRALSVGALLSCAAVFPASAADTGSISGTVTGPGGAPVEGAAVVATRVSAGGYDTWADSATDAHGNFTVNGLPAGTYRVRFFAPEHSDLLDEYWQSTPIWSSADATLVPVATGEAATGVDAELVLGGSISGTVTGPGGVPLEGAGALANGLRGSGTAPTDENGHFTIHGLPAGEYEVRFIGPEGSGLRGEYWQDTRSRADATPVSVALGENTTGIDAELALGGSISGAVTEPGGAPLAGVSVQALHVGVSALPGGTATTDQNGHYKVNGPLSGEYRVVFYAPPGTDWLDEYWQDTRSFADMTLVSVADGEETSGIDAELALGGSISGTVTHPSGAPLEGAEIWAYRWHGTLADDNGHYTIHGLAPGEYRVEFGPPWGGDPDDHSSDLAREYWQDAQDSEGATPVSVAAGEDTSGIDAQLDYVRSPHAPMDLSAEAGAGQVSLSWSAPTDNGGAAITDYVIQFRKASWPLWHTFADGVTTLRSATVTGLANGAHYYFRIAAKNRSGRGPFSPAASTAPRTVPDPPSHLTGKGCARRVALSWSAPSSDGGAAITDYVIQFRKASWPLWHTFPDGVTTLRSTTVTGLVNGAHYYFRIAANNTAGRGAWSPRTTAVPAAG